MAKMNFVLPVQVSDPASLTGQAANNDAIE